ncbi:MAG: dihydrolipoamide acetyltransferase family protein [Chlamydiales bacterium]|nr:dihydrolipoamide acetyltransferase family protein [Chlamydiales bacterium]
MPFTFTMPKLSPTMTEGTIAKWLKKEGEFIEANEVFVEIATDKATVEHAALDEGWLRKILVQAGDEVPVNQSVAIFTEKKDESIEGYVPEGIAPVKNGSVTTEKESLTSIIKENKPQPTTAAFKETLFAIEPPIDVEGPWSTSIDEKGRVKASPLARKLAKEKNLDLATATATGPGGRVTSKDLATAQMDAGAVFGSNKHPDIPSGTYEEEKLSPLRKVLAERLQQAKMFVPHFYVGVEIDVSALVALRDQLKNHDIKVTYNDLILKAAALVLRKHPGINSGFNAANNTIVRFKTIDISVAVSFEGGLITPIVRHADFKNVGQIASEVKFLADKARNGKLQPHEYKGGSFTISNLGMFGVDTFTAIVNPPQAAILAVGGIMDKPVVKAGAVVPGKLLNLILSADHRVIDGSASAAFLKELQHVLENPSILLL